MGSGMEPVVKARDILVVDDDISNLLLFRLLLEFEGFDVATASDGIKALETLENSDFRMVITDFNMPKMSGLELAVKVREQHPKIHVVLVTANELSDIVEDAADAGISRIFSKPVNMETLVTTIRSSLYPKSTQRDQKGSVNNEKHP
jgi:DNA-binding NtrC family response regulator